MMFNPRFKRLKIENLVRVLNTRLTVRPDCFVCCRQVKEMTAIDEPLNDRVTVIVNCHGAQEITHLSYEEIIESSPHIHLDTAFVKLQLKTTVGITDESTSNSDK